jgi:hypothetical protein
VYWSPDQAYSQSDDWLFNYPALHGQATRRLVNVDEWLPMAQDGESQRGFVKWMFQHYPRLPGRYQEPANPANHDRLNNWWEYVVNFNNHPETRN